MLLTNEQRDTVVGELKRIGADLNPADEQKQRRQAFMTEPSEELQAYPQQNPNATEKEMVQEILDNRAALRQVLSGRQEATA